MLEYSDMICVTNKETGKLLFIPINNILLIEKSKNGVFIALNKRRSRYMWYRIEEPLSYITKFLKRYSFEPFHCLDGVELLVWRDEIQCVAEYADGSAVLRLKNVKDNYVLNRSFDYYYNRFLTGWGVERPNSLSPNSFEEAVKGAN